MRQTQMNCPVPDKFRKKFEKFLDNYLSLDFAPFFEWFVLEEALGTELTKSEFEAISAYANHRWRNAKAFRDEKQRIAEEAEHAQEQAALETANFADLKFVAEN